MAIRQFDTLSKEVLQEVKLLNAINDVVQQKASTTGSGWVHLNDPKKISDILETLGDPLTRKILIELNKAELTALDIKNAIPNAPKTTLYRKLNELHDRGIVKIKAFVSKDTKKVAIYQSTLSGIQINMKNDIDLLINLR